MRSPSSWALISRLKTATGALSSTATVWAMLSASDVLPTPGRAARTMRLAFWKPPVSLSMPSKPLATPLTPSPCCILSRRSKLRDEDLLDVLELGHAPLLLDGEDLLLAAVEELVGVAGVLVPELGDLVARRG